MIIKGGTLIDGTGASPITDAAIFIKNSKIEKIGTIDDVKSSTEKKIIDATGKTILPGLIEMHVHPLSVGHSSNPTDRYFAPNSLKLLYAVKNLSEMLRKGYTTVRIMHGNLLEQDPRGRVLVSLRTAIERGVLKGCRLFVAGVCTSTAGHLDLIRPSPLRMPEMTADGVDEVRKQTRICLREEVDWIKTTSTGGMAGSMHNQPSNRNYTVDELKVIVDEAHAMQKKVASHSQGIVGCRNAIEAGVDTLEHAVHLDDELIEEILKKDLTITITVGGGYRREVLGETTSHYLPKLIDGRPSREVGKESRRKAMEAGVNIAFGTDCGHLFPPGKNAYGLEICVRDLSMSPMDAILTATKNSAKTLGRLNDLGTIEKGKIADMIIIDGNPLKNIKVLQDLNRIKVVIKEGKIEVDRRR